jgi:hypothetical protein
MNHYIGSIFHNARTLISDMEALGLELTTDSHHDEEAVLLTVKEFPADIFEWDKLCNVVDDMFRAIVMNMACAEDGAYKVDGAHDIVKDCGDNVTAILSEICP